MKQPGLDGRHRDADGTIHKKRGNTLNQNLPGGQIPEFGPRTTLKQMREKTGKESESDVRKVAKKLR